MVILLTLLSCGDRTDSGLDCNTAPTYQNWTQGFLRGKCQSCHHSQSSNRHGAPDGVVFDTHADAFQWRERIEATIIQEASMPPNGGVTSEDKELLQWWLDCSTP